jgi:2-dehydro-3-deoxygalactonokinase
MAAGLIGLDWGTTSFRAYRMDATGTISDRRAGDDGILQVPDGKFDAVLSARVGDWLAADASLPVLASGMIGSRQGRCEVDYANCPAGLGEIAAGIVALETPGRTIHFVPGLTTRGSDRVPDVMRGEETQIMGIVDTGASARLLLPGSHSKWVDVQDGRIAHFATFMTGEIFAAVKNHTILGRTMAANVDDADAFRRGASYGLSDERSSGGLLKKLFSARTLALFDELGPSEGSDYLSGLLIGAEVREGLAMSTVDAAVHVVGEAGLVDRYGVVLALAGVDVLPAAADAAARGLFRIAEAGGLL